jgi:hypothetical protein
MREGQAKRLESPRAQFLGTEKLEAAFQQKDQAHHHPDQDHGKIPASLWLYLHAPASSGLAFSPPGLGPG